MHAFTIQLYITFILGLTGPSFQIKLQVRPSPHRSAKEKTLGTAGAICDRCSSWYSIQALNGMIQQYSKKSRQLTGLLQVTWPDPRKSLENRSVKQKLWVYVREYTAKTHQSPIFRTVGHAVAEYNTTLLPHHRAGSWCYTNPYLRCGKQTLLSTCQSTGRRCSRLLFVCRRYGQEWFQGGRCSKCADLSLSAYRKCRHRRSAGWLSGFSRTSVPDPRSHD